VIDDNPGDRRLLVRQLRQEFSGVEVVEVSNRQGLGAALSRDAFELVLTDHHLGWSDGLTVLRAVRACWPDCAVVMYTGTGNEEIAVEGMKAGLDDYLLKSLEHSFRVPVAIRSALEKARRRREIREADLRYRSLFDGISIALYRSTPEGRFIDSNPALRQLLGYSSLAALQAVPVAENYADPADRPRWQALMDQAGLVRDFEVRYRRRDGTVIWVRETARVVRGSDGRAMYYEGSLEDITERREAERAREQSERRFRALVEHSADGIALVSAEAVVTYASPSVTRILGFTPEELAGRNGFELVHPEDLALAQETSARLVREPGAARSVGIRVRHKDGGWRILEGTASSLLRDPSVGAIVVNFRDVSERRGLEDRLRQAQKMEAVGQLAGGVAHDFNNVLTAISGFTEILLEDLEPTDRRRQDVEEIRRSVDRATALTGQLLAFSRRQILQPVFLDLNAVVARMDKMLRRLIGEDVVLNTREAPGLWPVSADPGQLEQVVVNIAVNARDAMPGGGELTLETANITMDKAYAREHPPAEPGDYVMLAVSDTGHGMDVETQRRVFEPFFTTKASGKGTGLGLATVYGIVKQSGGFIWVYSEPGHGTTFKVYLPRSSGGALALPAPEPSADIAGGTETILLIEDDDVVRGLARRMLAAKGYTVLESKSGAEALDICCRHAGAVHLLLTDVVMPEMGGRDVAQRVAGLRPEVRVVYMSGYTEDAVVRHGVLAADVAYVQKPFTSDSLARKVRDALDAPPRG